MINETNKERITMSDIIKSQPIIPDINTLQAKRDELYEKSTADNTRRAYKGDWDSFTQFCQSIGASPLPATPDTVSLYVTYLHEQGKAVSTIRRHLSTISTAHKSRNMPSPTGTVAVRKALDGAIKEKEKGAAPNAKKAVTCNDLVAMLKHVPNTLIGIRDRALLLIGFAGALRRSELVGLNVEDIEITDEGMILTIRRSKTDQEGAGQRIAIDYATNEKTCPVRAYLAWIKASGIESGAVFRHIDKGGHIHDRLTGYAVALIVKKYAKKAGLDPDQYAGHSLRSGFATTAAKNGVEERAIMKQTRHKSVQVVRRYIQEGQLFNEKYTKRLGL
jgi:site-specific recombinase XerD